MEYCPEMKMNYLHTMIWIILTNNVELKKPKSKEYVQCNFIYITFKHRQTHVWGQKSWYWLLLRGKRGFWLGARESGFWHAGNVLFLNLGGRWMGVFLWWAINLYMHNFKLYTSAIVQLKILFKKIIGGHICCSFPDLGSSDFFVNSSDSYPFSCLRNWGRGGVSVHTPR